MNFNDDDSRRIRRSRCSRSRHIMYKRIHMHATYINITNLKKKNCWLCIDDYD